MKVIISKPGIPIEEINKESFFAVSNNNKSPIGGASLWNGMMLLGNILYTCSSGHPILYSELPVYDEPKKYILVLPNFNSELLNINNKNKIQNTLIKLIINYKYLKY